MQENKNYQQSISSNVGPNKVFDALTIGLDKWWGPVDQPAHKMGAIFKISFGSESYWKFKVIAIKESSNITWECVESHQDHHIQGMDEEWLGTKLYWEINEISNQVEINFLHQGLVPQGVCNGVCSAAWDFYITDSLKNYLEEGQGKPGFM